MYRRTTDDDNTNSPVIDRQFYVNHEAAYESHELVAFMDFSDNFTVTSGIFFYDAQIDQREILFFGGKLGSKTRMSITRL